MHVYAYLSTDLDDGLSGRTTETFRITLEFPAYINESLRVTLAKRKNVKGNPDSGGRKITHS